MTRIATPEQFMDAFKALTRDERTGLFAVARGYCRGGGFQEAAELVNELVVRAGDGRRRWDMDVPFLSFAMWALKSIASGERRLARNRMPHLSLDSCADEPDLRVHFEANPHASAEDVYAQAQLVEEARRAIEFARRSLRDDPLALQVLEGLEFDMRPAEMRERFGVGRTALHNARGRVDHRLSDWTERRARRELDQKGDGGRRRNCNRSGRTQ